MLDRTFYLRRALYLSRNRIIITRASTHFDFNSHRPTLRIHNVERRQPLPAAPGGEGSGIRRYFEFFHGSTVERSSKNERQFDYVFRSSYSRWILSLPSTHANTYTRPSISEQCYANELLFRRCYYLFSLRYRVPLCWRKRVRERKREIE